MFSKAGHIETVCLLNKNKQLIKLSTHFIKWVLFTVEIWDKYFVILNLVVYNGIN